MAPSYHKKQFSCCTLGFSMSGKASFGNRLLPQVNPFVDPSKPCPVLLYVGSIRWKSALQLNRIFLRVVLTLSIVARLKMADLHEYILLPRLPRHLAQQSHSCPP